MTNVGSPDVEGVVGQVASLGGIIRSKEATGRPKDAEALSELYRLACRPHHRRMTLLSGSLTSRSACQSPVDRRVRVAAACR